MTDTEIDITIQNALIELKQLMIDKLYNDCKQKYGNFITDNDKAELAIEVELLFNSNPDYSFENMKSSIMVGVSNGYSIDFQLDMMWKMFKVNP